MIEFIPKAYAQSAATGNSLPEGGTAGIQELFNFVTRNIDNWIAGLIIIVLSYIVAKMASKAGKEAIINRKGDDVQESALILVERITTVVILIIGVTIAFAINGINFTAVIGALSLGLGFAFKDVLGNLISGVLILSQDRIRIGDFIKVQEILGTIVSIDSRFTVLQAIDGTEVVIPNQTMLNETLISYSTNPFRRVELIVGVDYKTNLPMVTSLIKGVIEQYEDIVPKPEAMVLVDEFGNSSINIKVLFWIESHKNWLTIRSNLSNRIKKAFDDLGVSIPFPIRTLKLDEDDRAFLKTMDSMKKGIVPEPAVVPSNDQVAAAASSTGSMMKVPQSPFNHAKPNAHTEPQSATLTPPSQINAKQAEGGAKPTHL
ncbi:mechanosensitive ion channel family protein [Candidatus Peregrinibacteria bacterium]|nr:MAG: mechanosensitive ion channel family protein [Candidatus Peregrinibacteria bacterium]